MATGLKTVHLPKYGKHVVLTHRDVMHPRTLLRRPRSKAGAWPVPTLPVDWSSYQGQPLNFPMDGNDTYGDCGEAMAAHGDNTFTGATGSESTFVLNALIDQYTRVSGGDNGLSEDQVTDRIWKQGIGGDSHAVIYDSLDIDATDKDAVYGAISAFGGICLGFSVPDSWIQDFETGAVWDGPAEADPANGHFVFLNGVDSYGRMRLITWGSWCWLTWKGLQLVQPSIFTVFSPRWFDPKTGDAPNKRSYKDLAAFWHAVGGNTITQPGPYEPPPPPHAIHTVGDLVAALGHYPASDSVVVSYPFSSRCPVVTASGTEVVISGGSKEVH